MVESTGLENRQPLIAVLGFKSLSLHQIKRLNRCFYSGFFVSVLSKITLHRKVAQMYLLRLPNSVYYTRIATPLSLRHTFTDKLKRENVEEHVVSEIVGHKHQNMTYGRSHFLTRFFPKVC